MIQISYDKEVSTTYVRVKAHPVATTHEVAQGVNVDLDIDGKVVGVEHFGTPRDFRQALLNDRYDELWFDLFDFVKNF